MRTATPPSSSGWRRRSKRKRRAWLGPRQPGDRVDRPGHAIEVVGHWRTGAVGPTPIYHEVGLRRLPASTLARVTGAVA